MIEDLLARFVTGFQKGIRSEMEAMRSRLGPFEIPLGRRQCLDETDDATPAFSYSFDLSSPSDKLVPGSECTLRGTDEEQLVTLGRVERERIYLTAPRKLALQQSAYTLIVYPWFLYEKLLQALDELARSPDKFGIENAFALFGKHPHRRDAGTAILDHDGLNPSQQEAVARCCDSSLTFVWGPPGTGKTRTLSHIVAELLHQEKRILLTSTTNAAVDQALAQLALQPNAEPFFADGRILRMGQSSEETFGTSLTELVDRLDQERSGALERLEERRIELGDQRQRCVQLLDELEKKTETDQLTLFAAPSRQDPIFGEMVRNLFSSRYAAALLTRDRQQQKESLQRRRQRLENAQSLLAARAQSLRDQLRMQEGLAVRQARLILATMTNVYLNKLLQEERFDGVIVEEAGMAILPTLFYCAALAGEKVIAVGDPRQLPPIVQSSDPFVQRAMGRDIFSIAVPHPFESELVVMLDRQYRMHPTICDLVSDLFYGGQLASDPSMAQREELAAHRPFPGHPLVLVDTGGNGVCENAGNFSRRNELTARYCVELARMAVADDLTSIGIITPYVEQARQIRRLLNSDDRLTTVECSTVHRFQGHERDLVIFDTVDAPPLSPGILLNSDAPGSSAANLLNVSISRARGKLVILAAVDYFHDRTRRSQVVRLIDAARSRGLCVSIPAQ